MGGGWWWQRQWLFKRRRRSVSHLCRGVDAGQKIFWRDFVGLLLRRLSGASASPAQFSAASAAPCAYSPFAAVVMILRFSIFIDALLSDASPQHPLQSNCRGWWQLQAFCVHIKWNRFGCTANHSRHSRNPSAAGRKRPCAAASAALFWREASDVAYAMIRSAF